MNNASSLQRGEEASSSSCGLTTRPKFSPHDCDKSIQYDCLRVQAHSILHAKNHNQNHTYRYMRLPLHRCTQPDGLA